jgi:hypothetical protein
MHVLLYIDPGSGSYLVQMIIASVLAGVFYIKGIWWKIKSRFVKDKKNQPENDDDE